MSRSTARVSTAAGAFVLLAVTGWYAFGRSGLPAAAAAGQGQAPRGRATTATLTRRDFVRSVRLSGTVEAIQSMTISAPRLSGPNSGSLVVTRLIRPGTTVVPGDLIVEFD